MYSNSAFTESVSRIGAAILSDERAYFMKKTRNQRVELKNNEKICFLVKGGISTYRVMDSLLTITINAPAVIGLPYLKNNDIPSTHYYRCNNECEMWAVNFSDAINIFSKLGLWEDAFNIITQHLSLYFQREALLNQPNIKSIVLEHAKYLWEQDEEVREGTSIYKFILSRNLVSRSAVHKAVRELTNEGIMEIHRGKLCFFSVAP